MSRKRLVEMARRNLAHVEAGTVDQAPGVYRVPPRTTTTRRASGSSSSASGKRVPLVLGFSAELRGPGTYRALQVADVPVLLTRGGDGQVRAFLNVCSHRGAIVVKEGTGSAKRFTCPYHAWSYDERGALVGVYKPDQFGEVDKSCLGLTPLPVAERAGLIFATLTPGATLDVDAFLCGYDEMLAHHRFDQCHVAAGRRSPGRTGRSPTTATSTSTTWPILHRDSFGTGMPSEALYDAWGPHQRVSFPNPFLRELATKPEDEWPVSQLIGGVWTIFPHISIADFDAGGKEDLHGVAALPRQDRGRVRHRAELPDTSEPDEGAQDRGRGS